MHLAHSHKRDLLKTALWRSLYEAGTLLMALILLVALCLIVVYSI